MKTTQRNRLFRGILLLWIALVPCVAFAQNVTLRGKVVDAAGQPLAGATVVQVDNTSNGSAADADGNFTLSVPATALIMVSYMGFVEQTLAVNGRSAITVTMVEDSGISLDDVVVIGYGTVRRRDLTGSVATVNGGDLAEMPVASVAQALQGRLPGVNVTTQDGRPDAEISIRVRGGGSITQSNNPLYIVDGMPVSNINGIPASEIESINVLKDASSTAIYGARGANGVILVITKSGRSGDIKVSYDGYYQIKDVSKSLETLSAQDYVLHSWSYATSRGAANGDGVAKYFGLGSKYGNHYADYARVKAHNYTDDLLRTATSYSQYVTVSGGTDKSRIMATLGYIDDQGIKINSGYNRANASFKIQQKLYKRLDLDFDLRYSESNRSGREVTTSGAGSVMSSAYFYRPIDNPLGGVSETEVAGSFGFGVANIDADHNPVLLTENIIDKSLNRSLSGTMALSWNVIDGLVLRNETSLSRGSSRTNYYEGGYGSGIKKARITRGISDGLRNTTTANYDFSICDDHRFGVLAGMEILESKSESSWIEGVGYPDNFDYKTTFGLINTALTSLSSTNTYNVPAHTLSYFGRLNYSFKDRYLFTATFRADGSSKFPTNNHWGYFPAAAMAWCVIDEPFMASTRNWLSELKLRLSYGTSGADNISSDLWRETWVSVSAGSNTNPINGERGPFYKPGDMLANPDLKWETTISRNIGIDYGLLNNRINGAIELYWNTTKDLLMIVPVDETTGYKYQYQNFGQTSNRGVEFSVNADIVRTKDFRFSAGAIYNYNSSKLDKMDNASQYKYSSYWDSSASVPTTDWMLVVGRPVGQVYGYISEGFYSVDDFDYVGGQYILKSGVPDISGSVTKNFYNPFQQGGLLPGGQTAFPGAPKFKDIDKSGMVDLDDVTSLGEVLPRHTGSFRFDLSYKNLDLGLNFNWVGDGQVYNTIAMMNSRGHEFNGIGENRLSFIKNAYKVYNVNASGDLYAVTDPAELNTLNKNAKYSLPYTQAGITSSQWMESAAYLRLQTVTLGYTLPKRWTDKIGIERARFYFTGGNLFTITGYSGIDPEVSTKATGQTGFSGVPSVFPTPNMDFGTYPRSRTFTFGANITF